MLPLLPALAGAVLAAAPALKPHDQAVVDRVRARAAVRLEGCNSLLADFRDARGRTLEENLAGFGVSAGEYLLGLPFADGSGLRVCRTPTVAMASVPGVPRIFLCPAGVGQLQSLLARVDARQGSVAEAMVIHEMLHTLGLGENPPTPAQITDHVRRRCR
jgi:hypothetical protein